MKMAVTAGKVLQTYYALRAERGKRAPKYYRKRTWEHADAFLAWCAEQEIHDPLAFLRYRFETGDVAGHTPQLHRLRSVRLAKVWRTEWKQAQARVDQEYARLKRKSGSRQTQALRALKVLTHAHEAVKQPYATTGRHALCLAQLEYSGGFHPESRYCPTCPMAVRCAAALVQRHGFDVVALRAGRITMLPPEIAVAAIK